jgi:hypothetical protein
LAIGSRENARRINQTASQNERVHLAIQQPIQANELLAIDRLNLQAVQKQLDLAMTWLDGCADESEMTI